MGKFFYHRIGCISFRATHRVSTALMTRSASCQQPLLTLPYQSSYSDALRLCIGMSTHSNGRRQVGNALRGKRGLLSAMLHYQ